MYCFKFQKFKKLFIVFITVLTISLTIGIYTITSSAISLNSDFYVGVNFNDSTSSSGKGPFPAGTYTEFYFDITDYNLITLFVKNSDGSFSNALLVPTNSPEREFGFESRFTLSYKNSGSVVFSTSFDDLVSGKIYNFPDYNGSYNSIQFTFYNPSFQLFTTRIVKNGSVLESGTAQLNKAIINPDSFTFSFYDSGLVGDSFRISAVQTTPTGFTGSAFPPLNINLGEVAKVVIYDKDGVELGFINGPFQENREYNILEYFPDASTFEIVISTPILVEETTNGLFASLGWVGSVLSNLVLPTGRLFPLLQLFVISICFSLLLLAFYYIRKAIWGA